VTLDIAHEARTRIEALFAYAREALPHERAAYIWQTAPSKLDPFYPFFYQPAEYECYIYQSLVNGKCIQQAEVVPTFCGANTAIASSVEEAKRLWPVHAELQLIWRAVPEFTLINGERRLYMRCVATPLNFVGEEIDD
jgi:hypothetical protein